MERKVLITSEWCGSCKEAKIKYDSAHIDYMEVQYDSEMGEKLIDEHNIRRIPALVYDGGVIIGTPEDNDLKILTNF